MPNDVYEPKLLPVRLRPERECRLWPSSLVRASAVRRRPEHLERAAALVVQGVGAYGTALDYLRNVVVHLDDFGIADCPLHRVLELAETMSVNRHGIRTPFSG